MTNKEETFFNWVFSKWHFWLLSVLWGLWSAESTAINILEFIWIVVFWIGLITFIYFIIFSIRKSMYNQVKRALKEELKNDKR
jgi:hypothetical protein